MLIYRFIGGLGVIVSGLLIYYVREEFEKKKSIQIDSYIKLISYIKTQVECFILPINTILDRCDNILLINCGFGNDINPKTITELLNGSKFYADEDFINKLYDFAQDFGHSYANDQIKLCDRYIMDLSKIQEKYSNQRTKDKKLSFSICLSISLSLILILI